MSGAEDTDEFIFRPQQHFDAKWLNPDLQGAVQCPQILVNHYNTIIQDSEVILDASAGLLNKAGITAKLGDNGKYYCGLRILTCTCCDGLCGPHSGCACGPCSTLSAEEELRIAMLTKLPIPQPSSTVIDELKWKLDPGPECLKSLLEALIWEQRTRAMHSAVTVPYVSQIRRLIVLCKRHLVAVIRPGTVGGYQPLYIVAAAPQGGNAAGGYAANGYQNAILLDPSGQAVLSPVNGYYRPGLGPQQGNPGLLLGAPIGLQRPFDLAYQDPNLAYQQVGPQGPGPEGQQIRLAVPFRQTPAANTASNANQSAAPAQQKRVGQSAESSELKEEPKRNARPAQAQPPRKP